MDEWTNRMNPAGWDDSLREWMSSFGTDGWMIRMTPFRRDEFSSRMG